LVPSSYATTEFTILTISGSRGLSTNKVMMRVLLAPAARSNTGQVITPVFSSNTPSLSASTNVVPVGMVSSTVTPVASCSPTLLIMIVYISVAPGAVWLTPFVFCTAISGAATRGVVSSSLSVIGSSLLLPSSVIDTRLSI